MSSALLEFFKKNLKSLSLAKALLTDPVLEEVSVDSELGPGFLFIQKRRSRKENLQYLVLKAKGGEATVFVQLSELGATQIVDALNRFQRKTILDR